MQLKPGAHVHLMGICGTAMASLAGLLKSRGYKVTGSDQNVYPPMSTQLQSLGISIQEGYRPENLEPRPDLVIVGNVIGRANPEAQALLGTDIPYTSLPKAMGELVIEDRHSIVVSGTHGKTTTTSMISWIASCLNLQPGFLIGGIPKNFGRSFQNPTGNWFVIEGDEYDTAFFDKVPKFIHYRPQSAILTSVEFDHADIYADLAAVKAAFTRLLQMIPAHGRLIYNAEDRNIQSILGTCVAPKFGFGFEQGEYQARNRKEGVHAVEFDVHYQGTNLGHVHLPLMGDYNIKNALSAFALSHQLGWDLGRVTEALEKFTGVKRRQEIIGQPGGVIIVEDFAHHPTAVRETILAVQARYPKAKVYSVFEARSATSRRKVFQKDYVDAFAPAHAVLLPPAFDQSKIAETDRFSVEELIADLRKRGTDVSLCESVDDIVTRLRSRAHAGDVILVMSNGGFEGIYQKLLAAW